MMPGFEKLNTVAYFSFICLSSLVYEIRTGPKAIVHKQG
jgi:hypothetical protein